MNCRLSHCEPLWQHSHKQSESSCSARHRLGLVFRNFFLSSQAQSTRASHSVGWRMDLWRILSDGFFSVLVSIRMVIPNVGELYVCTEILHCYTCRSQHSSFLRNQNHVLYKYIHYVLKNKSLYKRENFEIFMNDICGRICDTLLF